MIEKVEGWEVFDSRGNPTVRVRVTADGAQGVFTVPSGASTGAREALELRDGGDRFLGKGVLRAVSAVNGELAEAVRGMEVTDQEGVDQALVDCDGTPLLSRLGANAVLGVSGATAHAASASLALPLYRYLAHDRPGRIPAPIFQILNAGLHARGGIEVQDYSVIPMRATSLMEAMEVVRSVYEGVKEIVMEGGHQPVTGEEGGLSPPLASIEEAFQLLEEGVERAGHTASRKEVAFALDVASTHFYSPSEGLYVLRSSGESLSSGEMVDLVSEWAAQYPLVSIEDPLAEEDWQGWRELTRRLGKSVQILGDDLLVTNQDRVREAIETKAANSVLVKPNQTGTLTRAKRVSEMAKGAGWGQVVSARSGETCDSTISDLAVALDSGQLKVGSITGSERQSKYNRLLEICSEYGGEWAGAAALAFNLPREW
ncbi:MAG: phosphopyruvate hydratase [Methanomassiliicoccales archaeon]